MCWSSYLRSVVTLLQAVKMSTASSDGKTTSVVDDGFFIIHKCLKYVNTSYMYMFVCYATNGNINNRATMALSMHHKIYYIPTMSSVLICI